MPLPLLWLGAAVSAAYAGNEIAKSLSCDEGNIALFPGERSTASVEPVNGAVVCCGIYDVLIHTGVWWEGMVIELAGTGLIRAVSAERFLANRSGDNIYTACKPSSMVMAEEAWHFVVLTGFIHTANTMLSKIIAISLSLSASLLVRHQ